MGKQQKLIKEIPTLWQPEFIPFYPNECRKYGLNYKEGLIYGFVRFFLKNCSGKFFFTNEQLRYILGGKRDATISKAVKLLVKKCPEISVSYQIKENGGKIRLLEYINKNPDLRKSAIRNCGKAQGIENTNKEYLYINIREWFEKEIIIPNNQYTILLKEEKEKFIDYWSEKSPNGKKERWQMEKVFDIKRRWKTWVRNVEARYRPKEFKKEIDFRPRGGGMVKVGEVISKK